MRVCADSVGAADNLETGVAYHVTGRASLAGTGAWPRLIDTLSSDEWSGSARPEVDAKGRILTGAGGAWCTEVYCGTAGEGGEGEYRVCLQVGDDWWTLL